MSEIWNLSALCRCCHASDGALRSLEAPYVHDGAIKIYAVLLRDTFGLHVNPPTIEASYSICESCVELLCLAHSFKKQVQACEKKFHEYCENEQTINTSGDVKIEVDNENVIINSVVNIEDGYVANDDCDDINDSDGGYSDIDNEIEGIREKSDGDEKSDTIFCQLCNESFNNRKSYRSHVFEVHVANGSSCKICKRTFATRQKLKTHFNSSHKAIWRCPFCVEVFKSRKERDSHEFDEHVKSAGYVCDNCHKSFKCKPLLQQHMKWHSRTNELVCETCGHNFKTNFGLRTHIETVHENKRRFQCGQCDKAFKYKKSLMLHNYSHTGEFPFKCKTCSKGFKTKTDLRYHQELKDHDIEGKDEISGLFGGNLDDDGGISDSDGGYENNDDNGNESETEIDNENNINVEIDIGDTELTVGSRVDDNITEETAIRTDECLYDSPDDCDNTLNNDDIQFESEEEYKDNTNQEEEIRTNTSDKPQKKTRDKRTRRKPPSTRHYEFESTCELCHANLKSTEITKLRRHFNKKHVADDLFCTLCDSSFKRQNDILHHHMSKHLKLTFHCQYCIETFNTKKDLQTHERVHIGKGYTCNCCDKQFKFRQTLIRHLRCQMGLFEQHTCHICGRPFKLRSNLKLHIQFVHDKLKPIECDICGKRFSLKKHLVCHRRIHTGEKPFQCDICPKAFRSNEQLKCHRRRHGKNENRKKVKVISRRPIDAHVQCNICGKHYTTGQIKQHMTSHAKPFKCDLCDCRYGWKSLLIKHKVRNHLPNEELGVRCNFCSEYFTKETIDDHISKHGTSLKGKRHTLKCEICDKNYYNWEVHKKIHEKKPYKCNVCGRMYAEKSKLDQHLVAKHEKKRNFQCDMCNKKYTSMDALSIHKKRKHSGDTQEKKKERKNKSSMVTFDIDSALPAYAVAKKTIDKS